MIKREWKEVYFALEEAYEAGGGRPFFSNRNALTRKALRLFFNTIGACYE